MAGDLFIMSRVRLYSIYTLYCIFTLTNDMSASDYSTTLHNMTSAEAFCVIVELLNGLEIEEMECKDIIVFLKCCASCPDDFGDATRLILMDLLIGTHIICPIAIAKHYVERINEAVYGAEEPESFHSLVWLLSILLF